VERTSVGMYLRGAETMRRRELVWGVVREPPAPMYGHQSVLTRLTSLLYGYVTAHGLGQVCVAPVDVILDRDKALVVQPDLVFVAEGRLNIIDRRIWGAPDLVVEVISPRTGRRDRIVKLDWYRRYGVKEYWIVDPAARRIDVVSWPAARMRRRRASGGRRVRSEVLADLRLSAADVFDV
jgi:Uma2 family endonuclease